MHSDSVIESFVVIMFDKYLLVAYYVKCSVLDDLDIEIKCSVI